MMIFISIIKNRTETERFSFSFSTVPQGAIMETRIYIPTFVPCHIILGYVIIFICGYLFVFIFNSLPFHFFNLPNIILLYCFSFLAKYIYLSIIIRLSIIIGLELILEFPLRKLPIIYFLQTQRGPLWKQGYMSLLLSPAISFWVM